MAGVLDSMSYMYLVRKRRYKWYFTFTQFTFFIQVLNCRRVEMDLKGKIINLQSY